MLRLAFTQHTEVSCPQRFRWRQARHSSSHYGSIVAAGYEWLCLHLQSLRRGPSLVAAERSQAWQSSVGSKSIDVCVHWCMRECVAVCINNNKWRMNESSSKFTWPKIYSFQLNWNEGLKSDASEVELKLVSHTEWAPRSSQPPGGGEIHGAPTHYCLDSKNTTAHKYLSNTIYTWSYRQGF